MVYLEVNQMGGSSSSKTANYNTLIKALKYFIKEYIYFIKILFNYNQVTYLYK